MPRYIAYNFAMPTTAQPTPITTSTAVKTMLQIASPTTHTIQMVGWGISFDASVLATPGTCELLQTDVGATVTAHVAAGIQPYLNTADPASQCVITGTTNSGYTATVEGAITTTRSLDTQLVDPANGYNWLWVDGKGPMVAASRFVRVRVKFGAAINAICYMIWDE